ncbi:U5 small nuclear ribonucleoprotein component [Ranunculus cassubicifolius]
MVLQGPNLLLDCTRKVDKNLLNSVRDQIVQGFELASRMGPLCHTAIRNVKLKIIDAEINENPLERRGLTVAAKVAAHSAILVAKPKLMEPISFVKIQTPIPCQKLLQNHGAYVLKTEMLPGTLGYNVKGYLPARNFQAFEEALKSSSNGCALCDGVFDHWGKVPGDPVDPKNGFRARQYMLEARRILGLEYDVHISSMSCADPFSVLNLVLQYSGDHPT